MVILDTTKITTRQHIYQVNSSSNYRIFYFIIRVKSTSPSFIVCRIVKYLFKPHVKKRRQTRLYFYTCMLNVKVNRVPASIVMYIDPSKESAAMHGPEVQDVDVF